MTAGTTNKTPLPKIGDILNYVFLFAAENPTRDEGVKERPCMVVDVDPETNRVKVVPITTKGDGHRGPLAIPQDVADKSGLRHPSWINPTELNSFTWLGFDLRPLVATDSIYAGRMTTGFTRKICEGTLSAVDTDRD
jgi:hypothetical protein